MSDAALLNILLVDDQPAKLLTYESVLAELGENLLKANSAREAFAHLLRSEIAVVVMDVSMPDVDGFELAAMIREHPRCEGTSIIFVSAVHVSDLDHLKGYETGAIDYLPVPIVPQMLRAKVRVLCDLYRKTQQLARLNLELEQRVAERTEALEDTADRLQLSEARFRSLAEGMRHIVWESDADGNFTYFSPRWREFTGAEPATHFGWSWLVVVHGEDQERARASAAASVASAGALPIEFEARFRRYDGIYRWLHVTGEAVLREDGSVDRWVGTCVDTDERRRAEAKLREDDRRKDEFLAMLAHELRNPLAPIQNVVQLLRAAPHDEPLRTWSHGVIERQVRQLARLVEDSLDVSRMTRGKIRLRLERLDIAAPIEDAIEISRPFIEERKHALTVSWPAQPLEVCGDPVRLTQVIANLLNNAAKFQSEGGSIALEVEREGEAVAIRVRDRGIGLEPESLDAIFELFAQARAAPDALNSGLGIGLSLVRELVRLHGGSVNASSAGEGCGSEFCVRLPWLAPGASQLAPLAPDKTAGVPCRVLIVDDNRDAADSLAIVLRTEGHECVSCYSGASALTAAHALRPEAVLLDLTMPELDGFNVCAQLREAGFQDTYIVAVTGRDSDRDRKQALASGFDAHFAKPVDPLRVAKLVADVSARAALRARAVSCA
jgi:PAS domain S-box-containing protein